MPGACGMACEVCKYKNEDLFENPCRVCSAGTDPKASEFAAWARESLGYTCAVLECAIEKKVDYCLNCEGFPCDVHYRGRPYSEEFLNALQTIPKAKK